MPSTHTPSAELFVLQALPDGSESVIEQLAKLGQVDEVPAEAGLWVLRLDGAPLDPQRGWARIRNRIAQTPGLESVFAEPVLLDPSGGHHLPTGEVTIRFDHAPSDDELRAFAGAHRLRLRGRAPHIDRQAVFLLEDPANTYLPAKVSDLRGQPGVLKAWANTLSAYRRAR